MPIPAFTFTDRVVPVAEIGAMIRVTRGRDRWGRSRWGVGKWGTTDPETAYWSDIGCEVHEATTDTGRGSASDRFVPGTAYLVASNVSGWADGNVLTSSYFDDGFDRTGPDLGSLWARWPAMETLKGAEPLQIVDGAAEVVAHVDPSATIPSLAMTVRGTWKGTGSGSSVSVGPFPGVHNGDMIYVAVAVGSGMYADELAPELPGFTWVWGGPHNSNSGKPPPPFGFALYRRRATVEDEVTTPVHTAPPMPLSAPYNWVAFALTGVGVYPGFGDGFEESFESAWWDLFRGVATANMFITGSRDSDTPTVGGVFVARVLGVNPAVGASTPSGLTLWDTNASSTGWTFTQRLYFDGPAGNPTLYVKGMSTPADKTAPAVAPPASPWTFDYLSTSVIVAHGPPGPDEPFGPPRAGAGCAVWTLPYFGDLFIEATIGGLAAPDALWPDGTADVELALHVTPDHVAADIAALHWTPAWDDPADTGTLAWSILRRHDVGADTVLASGSVIFGAGGIGDPIVARFEADTGGALRLYLDGVPLGAVTDPDPATGQLVGIYAAYDVGWISFGGTDQMGPPRFEQVMAGTNALPPIHLEPGALMRIGVHHETFGYQWFFHGTVDAIVPVYDPVRHDTVRIEAIDALGEVGRLNLADELGDYPTEADQRITWLLDEAGWKPARRVVGDDATQVESVGRGKAVELLTQTAESCGGAVYGDPQTNQVVFRPRDWQSFNPDTLPDAYITNDPTPRTKPVVCPSGWERSWRRSDMTTRVHYITGYGDDRFYNDPSAEARYGIEPYDRTLVTIEDRIVNKLGRRQLRLRGPAAFPRVAAVLLDGRHGDTTIDLMTTATFTGPSRYGCSLLEHDRTVFDRQYLVTGVRHTISRDRWQCRLSLDIADVFAVRGGKWGRLDAPRARWGRDTWGESV